MQKSQVTKKKGGLPEFKPTERQRDMVRLWKAGGISEPVIAAKIGICQNTLRKHFSDDILYGRDILNAEVLEMLRRAAKRGNVAAMKELRSRSEKAEARDIIQGDGALASSAAPRLATTDHRVGKKEAKIDAAGRVIETTDAFEFGGLSPATTTQGTA